MTLDELRKLAQRYPSVYLTLTRGTRPTGDKVRLMGPGSPLGRYSIVRPEPEGGYSVVASFKSADILQWLDRKERA